MTRVCLMVGPDLVLNLQRCSINLRHRPPIMPPIETITSATKDVHRQAAVLQRCERHGLEPVKIGSRISTPQMLGAGLCAGSGRGLVRASAIRPRRRRAFIPVSAFGRTETWSIFTGVKTEAEVEIGVGRRPRNTLSQSRPSAWNVTATYFADILGVTAYAQTAYGIPLV